MMYMGIVCLALPIGVMASNFSLVYSEHSDVMIEEELMKKELSLPISSRTPQINKPSIFGSERQNIAPNLMPSLRKVAPSDVNNAMEIDSYHESPHFNASLSLSGAMETNKDGNLKFKQYERDTNDDDDRLLFSKRNLPSQDMILLKEKFQRLIAKRKECDELMEDMDSLLKTLK